MALRKRSKRQTMIFKTLHRKLKTEQYEPEKTGVNLVALKGSAVSTSIVTPVMLLLSDRNIIILW